jgi:long-chain acyl-CoA synthetase
MERIWLKSYPSGVPAEVDVDAFSSLVDLFDKSVTKFANNTAYVHMGATLTYAEIERLSRAFAANLRDELGLSEGARVALMMPNILQYPIAMFGALRAGCTVVNCNPLCTSRELARQLSESGAETIVVMENFASVVEEALPQTALRHVIVTQLGDMLGWGKGALINFVVKYAKRLVPNWRIPNAVRFSTTLRKGADFAWRAPPFLTEDIAFLQYTGGTTGVPKGAMLTHRNIVANLQQHHAQLCTVLREGSEIVITALPLSHIYGLTVSCLLPFKIGATNVLITNPRDIPGLIKELRRHKFTCFAGVNALFKALLENPGFARLDFSSLRIAAAGGAPLEEAVAKRWKAVTGKTLIEAYGLTETSPVVTCNPVDLREFNGSCGVPIPSTEVAIRDEGGADAPIGEPGELCVRGPQVMKGYWNSPEETAKVMTADGFLRTGDIATIDENGFVRIVDRKKDMINVSGFKVYPNEVEEIVSAHPGVLDVAAIGVPDHATGEVVKIVVVKRDPSLTAEELRAHCRKYLTPYKVPRIVEFREELPKTGLGKTLRRDLRGPTVSLAERERSSP